jgi:hypothetical protein
MALFGRRRLGRHLLVAAGLLLAVCVFVVARNWETFATMYANVTAMNEGSRVAESIRRPDDLLGYLADHPERTSLVAYEVGARGNGLFYQSDERRPVVNTSHLLLLAEYARRVETGQMAPDRPVPLDSLDVYALPGAGLSNHREVLAHWRDKGRLRPDSTVALRHVVEAIPRFGDPTAADWLLTALGRVEGQSLPERWGLDRSDPPLPGSGVYLSWIPSLSDGPSDATRRFRSTTRAAYTEHAYRLARRLRRDSAFRARTRQRLRRRGSGLSLPDQRRLAQSTSPKGTAADYADLLARSLHGRLGSDTVSTFVRRQLESPVESDSLDAPIAAIGTDVGALPGVISFVGYVRYADDRPPRVAALFLEDLPMGLFYHVLQTSLDKGLLLRLLTDPDFFRRAKTQLSSREPTSSPSASSP